MNNPSFFLEGVVKNKNEYQDFEGPLSLILMLLQKNKIEIRDISISDILEQYLAYLDEMQSMDLEIASEFVQMASHLLYIKTKTLLAGGEEEVSELELLMASLEQLKCKDIFSAVQKITPELKKASELGLLYYAKMPEPEPGWAKEYKYNHEPVDLLKALYAVYSRGGKTPEREDNISSAIPKRINFSVKDKSRHIIEQLKASKLKLDDLYTGCHSRSEIVATFVAVLELCSMGSISISIKDNCYELEFVGGNVDEIIEKIVE